MEGEIIFSILQLLSCIFGCLLVVAVTNPPKYSFNRCKSATCKLLSRDTKSARDKNGTKPRKNKVKNTLPEISLVEYLCFVCKGTNLSEHSRSAAFLITIIHTIRINLPSHFGYAILIIIDILQQKLKDFSLPYDTEKS